MRLEHLDDYTDERDYDRNHHGSGSRHHEYRGEHSPREPRREDRWRSREHKSDSYRNRRNAASEDFIEDLEESLYKELNDVLRYCDMSKEAEDEGLYEIAAGLSEIAKEEFTHATFLNHHLKRMGSESTDPEIVELWHDVNHVMHIS